jgi:hypothetical protein
MAGQGRPRLAYSGTIWHCCAGTLLGHCSIPRPTLLSTCTGGA